MDATFSLHALPSGSKLYYPSTHRSMTQCFILIANIRPLVNLLPGGHCQQQSRRQARHNATQVEQGGRIQTATLFLSW
jgi:hypothetical protein